MMKNSPLSVSIPIGKEKLAGFLYIPLGRKNQKSPSVVIFHGRGSSKKRWQDRGEALSAAGIMTLVFDFRGCGKSDGKFEEQTIAMGYEDAVAGYSFLRNHELCDTKRLGVLGGSFGGYQAALLSGIYPITSLVLAAPAIYQDDWWNAVPEQLSKEHTALYKQQSGYEKTRAMQSIRKYAGPLLLVEHEKDEIIPSALIQAYYDSAVNSLLREKKLIPNAPHALHDEPFITQSIKIVADWFTRTLLQT